MTAKTSCTDGQRLAIRDALLSQAWTRELLNTEEATHVARVATQALDRLAANPPAVDPGEGARRIYAAVREQLQPYRDVLTGLDWHIEPTEEQATAIRAIHEILMVANALHEAMKAAGPPLNRLGLTLCADYRA